MKVTIVDVARRAGVSKTTVSRILNHNYEHATPETVERVLNVIKELDYRPNALAKSLKQIKTHVIGIILSNILNPFWVRVLEGVENTCRAQGYNLMICNSNDDPVIEEEHILSFQLRQVDGIIVNPTWNNQALFKSLVQQRYPLVAINRRIDGVPADLVAMDNIRGAETAVRHLLDLGKRRIALLVYTPEGISPRLDRIEGYRKALRESGLEADPSLIRIVEERKGNATLAIQELLHGGNRPDAIFSTNNMMTLEILEGIKEIGLRVPRDIALIGYDETVWSKHLDPPLTTINQPAYEMGVLAAQRLIELIETKERTGVPQETVLQPELIVRRSCGAT